MKNDLILNFLKKAARYKLKVEIYYQRGDWHLELSHQDTGYCYGTTGKRLLSMIKEELEWLPRTAKELRDEEPFPGRKRQSRGDLYADT